MTGVAHWAAFFLDRYRLWVLGTAILIATASILATKGLKVSTKLEALMPEGAASVQTLNHALEKAGSFASIQVVIEGDDKKAIESALFVLESIVRPLNWSDSVQYFEDVSVLERHKLLQLDVSQLEDVEASLESKVLAETASSIENTTGIPITITLTGGPRTISSAPKGEALLPAIDFERELNRTIETERRFVSEDGRGQALMIWPKPGYEGLADAKTMITDIARIIRALDLNAPEDGLRVGIAGRISNKVTQYDAVLNDVGLGLGTSISLIAVLLLFFYRSVYSLLLIMVPLVIGIAWTIGLTTMVIGGLNLVTIFLALILFGLGIDFGIHNLSRYSEARGRGHTHLEALSVIIGHTGKASLYAALTTSLGFLSLLLTEFRAFREFGFIAGSGILLILVSMYTVFPAVISAIQHRVRWTPIPPNTSSRTPILLTGIKRPHITVALIMAIALLSGAFATGLSFEKNFRNIQADKTPEQLWATKVSKSIFRGGHDRAVLVVETLEEVEAIEAYFEAYVAADSDTPTIAQIVSIRNFVPNSEEQAARLAVINRMWETLEESGPVPDDLAEKTRYLQIDELTPTDLPSAMRRVFLGDENKPGYLMYIYNSVTMDDADFAKQFYDDAAQFTVDGTTYFPASEGFIFVEMLGLMKADAFRAVVLVSLVTTIMILTFTRSLIGTLQILAPTAIGMAFTLAIMVLADLRLSIINMVILPSLVGISVDNGIHIYERYRDTGERISDVMLTTGRAASITTLTTLMGFGGLITASMGGLRSMGFLALIGFSVCLVMTWIVLPFLLTLHKPKPGGREHTETGVLPI